MTTAVQTAPLPDTLLQLDIHPTCDNGRMPNTVQAPCENRADWFISARCCGLSGFKCDAHLTALSDHLADYPSRCNNDACLHIWPAGSTLTAVLSRIARI